LLGIWIGALAAFGGLFVPAAFANLPTQLAAAVLGDGFRALDVAGGALGVSCVLLGWVSPRGGADRARALLPLIGVLAHAASSLAVTPKLHALRVAAGGTIGRSGADELAQFASLHSASRALFALAAASALIACVWDLFALRARASRDTERSDF
jgi:hypothetical protein